MLGGVGRAGEMPALTRLDGAPPLHELAVSALLGNMFPSCLEANL